MVNKTVVHRDSWMSDEIKSGVPLSKAYFEMYYKKKYPDATSVVVVIDYAKKDYVTTVTWIEEKKAEVKLPYATVSRGSYSFVANSEWEKTLLQDFLGIKPAGVDIDSYLSTRSYQQLLDWKNYWVNEFSKVGRSDLVIVVNNKFNEYSVKVSTPYVYKKLPPPPSNFTGKALELYQRLDTAMYQDNKTEGWAILREMNKTEMSPIVVLAAIGALIPVITAIIAWLGSVAFAKFLMEESLQTLDFAIKTASDNKDWESMGKALAMKKEFLDETMWEKILSLMVGVNVIAAAYKYYDASRMKYEIDKKAWEKQIATTDVNKNANLTLAIAAVDKGEDPTQYLPSTTPLTIPETISGTVISVIDGDTIDVQDMTGVIYRIRMTGIDAPEFKTNEGKASGKYLTDQIYNKRVNVKVDPSNQKDQYGRVLGVVFLDSTDINKKMLSEGYAQYYFIGKNKYYSDEEYIAAAKRKGKVSLTSKPTYCKIYIDQNDTGKLTSETIELPEGTYTIGLTKEGYVAQSQLVTILPDKTIEIRFELSQESVSKPLEEVKVVEEEGKVVKPVVKKVYVAKGKYGFSIDTTPDLALVYYNNRKRKYAADKTYITSTQSGTVVVRMEGYEDVSFDISLIEKDVKYYKVDLTTGTWEEVS